MNFSALTDCQLIHQTSRAVKIETSATTNVVRHFVEIFRRELYLERGYGSMFKMATKEFGYDGASAQRRINAMELALAVPDLLEKIDSREMTLQSSADIQTFLNAERGKKKPYSTEQTRALVEACVGRSTREVQIELANRNPEIDFRQSKKFVARDRMQITYTTSVAVEEKLDRIRSLLSHVNPYMNREQLLDYMAELTLEKLDPARKAARAEASAAARALTVARDSRSSKSLSNFGAVQLHDEVPFKFVDEVINELGEVQLVVEFDGASESSRVQLVAEFEGYAGPARLPEVESVLPAQEVKRSRYITAHTRREVQRNSPDQSCSYVDRQSKRRCGSTHQLQIDHIYEFARGGSHDVTNLQMMCAKHNRFRWRHSAASFVKAPIKLYA